MQFEGDKDLPLPPGAVFGKLSDARFLVECIPGREAVALAEERKAVVTQRPGFAFVRGTLEITLQITEATPDSAIKYTVHGKGIGSTSDVETAIALEPKDGGTHIHWKSEVKALGGLLKMVPGGLIRGAAQKTITDMWEQVEKRLKA